MDHCNPYITPYDVEWELSPDAAIYDPADYDGDGVANGVDCAVNDPTRWQFLTVYSDQDRDGYGVAPPETHCLGASPEPGWILSSALDNCPLYYNPDQANADGDSKGDICDTDGFNMVTHISTMRTQAKNSLYACATPKGTVYFRYAYGLESTAAPYLYFYPVYSSAQPLTSCTNSALTQVQGVQSCLFFDCGYSRWDLYVSEDVQQLAQMPEQVTYSIANNYDCENCALQADVTIDMCQDAYTCTLVH
jgi:hypothetical protein